MRNITLITGPAGTGKSHKLRELIKGERRKHLVMAPTGQAAVNIGGATVHRTFKIHPETMFISKKWRDVEIVYVDEASMVGRRLFEAILAGAPNADIVLVGDMAQLQPVKDKFWFESPYVRDKSLFNIQVERLQKQWRQAEDEEFTSVLNCIRNGTVTRQQLRYLYGNSTLAEENEDATVLAYRNDTVRAVNAERLLSIDGELTEIDAEYTGFMKQGDCIAEPILALKEKAEIIMLNNDPEGRWTNGTRGQIEEITYWPKLLKEDEDELVILVRIGKTTHKIEKHSWNMKVPQEITPQRRMEIEEGIANGDYEDPDLYAHFLTTGIEYVIVGSCQQYPMKLAYAFTVHKAQGMTLDKVNIMTSGFAGTNGIGYVALSRAKSLDGVTLDRKPTPSHFKFDSRIKDFL